MLIDVFRVQKLLFIKFLPDHRLLSSWTSQLFCSIDVVSLFVELSCADDTSKQLLVACIATHGHLGLRKCMSMLTVMVMAVEIRLLVSNHPFGQLVLCVTN